MYGWGGGGGGGGRGNLKVVCGSCKVKAFENLNFKSQTSLTQFYYNTKDKN